MKRTALFTLWAVLCGSLGSCRHGDLGPLGLPLKAHSSFELSSARNASLNMASGERSSASFFYDKSREKLFVSVGPHRSVFRGARFNMHAGHLISSPSDSDVRDERGLRVGVQITRTYAGGSSQVRFWDYRTQIFTERNEVLASGTAQIAEYQLRRTD